MSRPFIPSWLDDARLTPIQFRILTHLWRRADSSGKCWPSGPAIASACKVNVDSVWPAIAILESRGFLDREKAFRNSNRYTLRVTGKEGVTKGDESPEKEGLQSPESEGLHPLEKRGRQSLEKEGCKGSPKKVPQLRESKEGKKQREQLSDSDFIESLKAIPAYAGISIEDEIGKMQAWLLTRPGRKLTRRFAINWLNRAEKPMALQQREPRTLNLGKRGEHTGYNERGNLDSVPTNQL